MDEEYQHLMTLRHSSTSHNRKCHATQYVSYRRARGIDQFTPSSYDVGQYITHLHRELKL